MFEEEEEALATSGEWTADLHWLTNDLALGGCFPQERAQDLAERHNISAVVDLRGEDCDDHELLRSAGITFLHLPTPDMDSARLEMLEEGVAFVGKSIARGEKVLIHCQHGIGRSALLALCVLVDQGFEPLQALELAKDKRPVVSPSQRQYEGWAKWLRANGHPVPDAHSFGCIAYRHLA